ncbi:indolepyruvate oxidoreductase subunit beta [Calderihabitans maritimus]|uniref:indolepyruvate oxidoreductase subunit beta n=1 Tax=Calderihabitans maritimus TaxID=1246530 RepID=UPI000B50CA5C|nr:indolepyruvate oxidoreductase subunit beta [Calderihabitans maritimus]
MSKPVTNVLLVGVGGQGTVLAGKVLSEAALHQGGEVKLSEIHGMSQRGGSVVTQVRFGPKVYSPIIKKGEADLIVAFEKMEGLRWIPFLSPSGRIIVNDRAIEPMPVIIGAARYFPDVIDRIKRRAKETIVVNASDMAMECGNIKAANMVMMGVAAKFLKIRKEIWLEVLAKTVPQRTLEVNQKAFLAGFAYEGF